MDKLKGLWEAASVERFHATPHHQPYSVGLHCYRMLVLLHCLHPKPHRNALNKAIMFHDSAERWVGDTPATAKWFVAPGIQHSLADAEENVLEVLGVAVAITQEDRNWVKALDLLELYLYCLDEFDMGNQNMTQCRVECEKHLKQGWVPEEITKWMATMSWDRTDDSFEMRP